MGVALDDLPPLCDFVAVSVGDDDPAFYDAALRQLGGECCTVRAWSVAVLALPGAPPLLPTRQVPAVAAEGGPRSGRAPGWSSAEDLVATARSGDDDLTAIHLDAVGTVTAVRSCGGRVPLYVSASPERTVVATRLNLVAPLTREPQVDRLAAAMWATGMGMFPDGRTPLAGTVAVERGAAVEIREGKILTTRYWLPETTHVPRPSRAMRREHLERYVDTLVTTLRRELPATGTLLSLSGGTDSSSLAYLAVREVGARLRTYSLLPADPTSRAYERAYIDPLLADLGITDSTFHTLTAQSRAERTIAAPPSWLPTLHPVLHWLQGGREPLPTALLGGERADEVVGSRNFTLTEWVQRFGARDLLRPDRWPRQKRTLRLLRDRAMGRDVAWEPATELADVFAEDLRTEYRHWRSRWLASHPATGEGRLDLHRQLAFDAWLAMNWEVCAGLGIRRVAPFQTRRMLELAYELHPSELVDVADKLLARRALRGRVPDRYLDRPGKERWGFHEGAVPALPDAVGAAVAAMGIVRPDALHGPMPVEHVRVAGALGQLGRADETGVRR